MLEVLRKKKKKRGQEQSYKVRLVKNKLKKSQKDMKWHVGESLCPKGNETKMSARRFLIAFVYVGVLDAMLGARLALECYQCWI